jgi:hypothetical protein
MKMPISSWHFVQLSPIRAHVSITHTDLALRHHKYFPSIVLQERLIHEKSHINPYFAVSVKLIQEKASISAHSMVLVYHLLTLQSSRK